MLLSDHLTVSVNRKRLQELAKLHPSKWTTKSARALHDWALRQLMARQDDSIALRMFALACVELGLNSYALHLLRCLHARHPDDVCSCLDLTRVLWMVNQEDRAVSVTQRICERGGIDGATLRQVAEQWSEWGMHSRAARLVNEIGERCDLTKDDIMSCAAILLRAERTLSAVSLLGRVIKLDPLAYEARILLGQVLLRRGKRAGALRCFERAASAAQEDVSLALLLQAKMLSEEGDSCKAIECLSMIKNDPVLPEEALDLIVGLCSRLGDRERAAGGLLELAARNFERRDFSRALEMASRAECMSQRRCVETSLLIVRSLQEMNRSYEALSNVDEALCIFPQNPALHVERSFCLLRHGKLREGWQEYEYRHSAFTESSRPRLYPGKLWTGEDVSSRTVLVHAEQGLGDTIQFLRFCLVLSRRGARVKLRCQPRLVPLLVGCSFLEEVCDHNGPTMQYDYQVPLMSLPLYLGIDARDIECDTPYIRVPPTAREETRRQWYKDLQYIHIGLSWAGNPDNINDEKRSIHLASLAPLGKVTGAFFYSLQAGPAASQLYLPPRGLHVQTIHPAARSIESAAAVIEQLDLVITVDTMIAHLSGALDVPTWVLLPTSPDWRYGVSGETMPWYSTFRLFRLNERQTWCDLVSEVGKRLQDVVASRGIVRHGQMPPVKVSIGESIGNSRNFSNTI